MRLSLVTVRLRGHFLALATLAFGLMVDSLTVGLTDVTGGPSGLVGIPSFSIAGYVFGAPLQMYYLVAALIVVLVRARCTAACARASAARCKSVRTDQTAAAALGVNVARYKLAAVCLSARARLALGQPLRLLFPFPLARHGRHAALVRDDRDAGRGRRGDAGRADPRASRC